MRAVLDSSEAPGASLRQLHGLLWAGEHALAGKPAGPRSRASRVRLREPSPLLPVAFRPGAAPGQSPAMAAPQARAESRAAGSRH